MAHRADNPFAPIRILTPQNVMVLLGGAALYFGAVSHQAPLLALGLAILSVPVLSLRRASRVLQMIRVTRKHHPRAFEEQVVPVELRLANISGDPCSMLVVEDEFPPSSAHRLGMLVPETLAVGGAIQLSFAPTCTHKRGLYMLGPVRIKASDPLGWFTREVIIEHFSSIVVYPNSVDLTQSDLLGEGTLRHVGMETHRRAGFGEEFMGVRDYRAGDPLRLVHWRSSARHKRLMVKEFEEQITTRVSVFLDLGRRGLVGVGDQTSVEYAIKAAAAIGKRTVELGHELELFAIGEKVDHLTPGMGTGHLLSFLDRLAFIKPTGDSGFPMVVLDLANRMPRGSTAVILAGATTIELEHYELVLETYRRQRVRPLFILIDDRAFLKVFGEQETTHATAMKLDDLVRELAIRGASVRVIRRARTIADALLGGLEVEAASLS